MGDKQVFLMSERELCERFSTSPKGLDGEEVLLRRQKYGKNAISVRKAKTGAGKILSHFKNPMLLALVAAAVISCAVAIIRRETYEFFEFAVILVILVLNAALSLIQEHRAESAFKTLEALNQPFSKVRRGGVIMRVKSENLVPGDVVILSQGDKVPADIRLTFSVSMRVSEAALTGESAPVAKDAFFKPDENARIIHRKNMAYRGSSVVYGRGEGVVTAVGMDTEEGKIADMISGGEKPSSPLSRFIDNMIKFLSVVAIISAVAIFVCALIKEVPFEEAFLSSAAIAVASFPEGMPVIAAIIFASSLKDMSKKNAVIRRLTSIETLGACDVICTGKTGVITLNRMVAEDIYTPDNKSFKEAEKMGEKLALCCILCNDCYIQRGFKGDPTEAALAELALLAGYDYESVREKWRRVDEIPFDGEKKIMTTVNTDGENKFAFVKGAADEVAARCSYILKEGKIHKIGDSDKDEITSASRAFAESGRRVMAFAYKEADEFYERGLIFIGLIALADPPAEGTAEAVENARKMGIKPVMITGDHPLTAKYAAKQAGIYKEGDKILTGDEIKKMTDGELSRAIKNCTVFAYVAPECKVRIVREFKKLGNTVAMTGEGINDAPSMREADVGILSGNNGSDEAREACSLTVTDGKFSSVIGAVDEGRRIYHNVVKAAQYLVSSNIAEVLSHLIISIFILSNGQEFLPPVMILWINLVTDCLPAVSIGAENDGKGAPKPGGELKKRTIRMTFFQGLMKTAIIIGLYCAGRFAADHHKAVTMCFIGQCMMQLFHSYNMKSQTRSLFDGNPFLNARMNISFIVGTILLLFATLTPGVSGLFHVEKISFAEWSVSISFAFMIIPLVELQKFLERKFCRKRANKDVN